MNETVKRAVERLDKTINDLHDTYVDGVARRAEAISNIPGLANWDKVSNSELIDLLDAMDRVLTLKTKLFGRI